MKILSLYDDQKEVMADLSGAMRRHKSILLQSPTGSGKTKMAMYIIIKTVRKIMEDPRFANRRVVFTVPRKDLLEQTSKEFNLYGIAHSYIASGKPHNPFAKVYIAMVDTAANRIEVNDMGQIIGAAMPEAYIVLVDETHFGAAALGKIIRYYKQQGAWVIGLSATPWKLNGEGLGKWYDHMVMGKTVRWLIDNKRLSDYDYYYGVTKPDLSKIKVTAGDYAKGELADFMEHQGAIIGDCVNDYRSRCMGRLHIVRCASIKHSQMVAASFRDAGITFVHVDGETPMDERERIFKAYARREILGLTFCSLLSFGFDLSQASGMDVCIESGSDLKPTKSLADITQFRGRMMRYKPYNAVINDHVNNYIEHDLPCTDRDWTLADRPKAKKGEREPVPQTKQCPTCYYVHPPAPACPQCGHIYVVNSREIENVEGDLQKMDKDSFNRSKKEVTLDEIDQMILPMNDRDTLEYLIGYAQANKIKNAGKWAAKEMAKRINKRKDLHK